ncbi:MAG: hypothetical protein JXQ27_08320 [Acidobacteria bacterium]|nr:hypothetical protein [Acidobacteriota bacterium]
MKEHRGYSVGLIGCLLLFVLMVPALSVPTGRSGAGHDETAVRHRPDPAMTGKLAEPDAAGLANGTWTAQTSGTTHDLRCVHFTSDNEGWAVGTENTLLHTLDGGVTWTPVTVSGLTADKGFQAVRFLDANVGWAGGPQCVVRTRNGGSSWDKVTWSGSVPVLYRLFPLSESTAWGVGRDTLASMQAYWQVRYTFNPDNSLSQQYWTNVSSTVLLDVFFVDTNTGWAVGTNGKIIKITNALGASPTFTDQASGTTEGLRGIIMLDANTGWIAGTSGTILHTTNGGGTWNPQTSNTAEDLDKVHFIDALNGWIVGDGGTILATTDGGVNWAPETSGTGQWLRWVHFVNDGWAVGQEGVILKRSGTVTETPPSIVTSPQNVTICSGDSTLLAVSATGTPPLHYQWYQGSTGDTSTPVGADSSSYQTPALTATTTYWVRVSNSFGDADSAAATVTVVTSGGPCDSCAVLLVSPDSSLGDISQLVNDLSAYEDLDVTVWDNADGTPVLNDLVPYGVVVIGNNTQWGAAGLDAAAFGNILADYIDAGGAVVESLYVQSFDAWGFGGTYLSGGYSPFTTASLDNWDPDDLAILEPGHPVLEAVSTVHDNFGHQDPGVRGGAEQLADWADSDYPAIAVNDRVVALNMLIFNDADWTGDVPRLLYNAIKWLCSTSSPGIESYLPHFAQEDGAWLTELTLANPTNTPQDVTLEVYAEAGGAPVSTATHTLAAHGGLSQPVDELFDSWELTGGWIRLRTATDAVKGIMKFTGLFSDATSSLPTVYLTAPRLVFPLMESTAWWMSAFALVNPGDSPVTFSVYAYTFDGTLVGSFNDSLAENGKYVRFLSADLFGLVSLPEKMFVIIEANGALTGFALTLSSDYTEIVAVPAVAYQE